MVSVGQFNMYMPGYINYLSLQILLDVILKKSNILIFWLENMTCYVYLLDYICVDSYSAPSFL